MGIPLFFMDIMEITLFFSNYHNIDKNNNRIFGKSNIIWQEFP